MQEVFLLTKKNECYECGSKENLKKVYAEEDKTYTAFLCEEHYEELTE